MRTLRWTFLLILAGVSGCPDATAPLPFQPGTYASSMWTYTADGLTTDYLQDGGTLSITLDPNGQLSGSIELPPFHFPNRDSVALVIPVQGSYELGETRVRIAAPGVPILNGIQLRFDGGSLAGHRPEQRPFRIHPPLLTGKSRG